MRGKRREAIDPRDGETAWDGAAISRPRPPLAIRSTGARFCFWG